MAKLQLSTHPLLPIFYNLSGNVGRNSPNQPEDVALVSFLMRIGAKGASPRQKPILERVTITNAMTRDLQDSIDDYQNSVGGPSDGVISVAAHTNGAFAGRDGRQGVYLIVAMNYWARRDWVEGWPRLDRIPFVPPLVVALAKRSLLGPG